MNTINHNKNSESKEKENAFLGLYFPAALKAKVAEAAKADERSMSQFAVRVFKAYFDSQQNAWVPDLLPLRFLFRDWSLLLLSSDET